MRSVCWASVAATIHVSRHISPVGTSMPSKPAASAVCATWTRWSSVGLMRVETSPSRASSPIDGTNQRRCTAGEASDRGRRSRSRGQ